jgi:hypothetical protein
MERVLTCECGEKIVVSRAQAGQEVKCGSCGAIHQVPTLRGLANLPLATASSQPQVAGTRADTWGWRGPVTASCLAVLLIATTYTGYALYVWAQIDTSFNADVHVELSSAEIDDAGLDSVLLAWDDYSKVALGSKRPPYYKELNDYSAKHLRHAIVGSVIIAGLSLVTFSTIRSAKKRREQDTSNSLE